MFEPIYAKQIRTIVVMVSQRESFAYYDHRKHSWEGLDIKIIENFAKKHKLKIKYIPTAKNINEIFGSDDRSANFSKGIEKS